MTAAPRSGNDNLRYEPEERPPPPVTIGVALQAAAIILAPIVITVVIVARIAQQPDSYIQWAVFAVLLISGISTIIQAVRLWRIGAGHVLMMGTSGAFIAVCVAALQQGGPATMASLIVVSSLIQFLLASRLSLLRRIFTPVVSGTVIMLIAVTVIPIVLGTLNDIPDDAPPSAAPVSAAVTLIIVAALVLRGPPMIRLWSPLIAMIIGCAVAAAFGIYDYRQILDAPWIGVPFGGWPGFDFTPGPEFWALLPAFIMVTLVGAIETIGDGVAIQRVSRRRPRATDFRVVQGALNADGAGNLLSGIAGTLPNTTYSSSISLAEVTGIAARQVGVAIGLIFILVAFFPKIAAILIAIPGPVAAAYVTLLLGLLFVQGMKIIVDDGLDHRKAAIAGLAFWVGVGFQNQWIFADQLGDGFLGILLGNGMTSGAIIAVTLTAFLELTGPRPRRIQLPLDGEALPPITRFLQTFAARAKWSGPAVQRLTSAAEETLAILLQDHTHPPQQNDTAATPQPAPAHPQRRLSLTARAQNRTAELEFVTALDGENMEDYLTHLSSLPPAPNERELSFRLLLHHAAAVRHQKYHDIDIITVTVDAPR